MCGEIELFLFSVSEEFVQVLSSDNRSKLSENFNLSLSWAFLIHGWKDSMFKDPKWQLNGRGIVLWSRVDILNPILLLLVSRGSSWNLFAVLGLKS